MIAILKGLSLSSWVIVGLAVALFAAGVAVKVQSDRLAKCKASMAEMEGKISFQNQKIEMFRMEAALMGQSLKKHKAEAVKLRAASKKKAVEIIKQPVVATCNKAVVASTLAAQRRLSDTLNDYPDNTRDE
jgi:hypothetical protein